MCSTLFKLYRGGQGTYPCFLGVPFTSTLRTMFFQSHWLLSDKTIVVTMVRETNPVAMTNVIIYPKELIC